MNSTKSYSIFETYIYTVNCDLDAGAMIASVHQHVSQTETQHLSNVGGYQAHNFNNEQFNSKILSLLPASNKPLTHAKMQCWANINQYSDWNDMHNHLDHAVILSGVWYAATPKNSGNIRFYDPRMSAARCLFDSYFLSNSGNYVSIKPYVNLLMFFPPWLNHMVEPNQSTMDRISIAFNILEL